MKRDRISFEDFKNSFIAQPDGYFPVYSCLDEDYEGEPLRVFRLDMICEWRLTDGKVKFLEVPFDTQEQFDEMVAYLRVATDLLNKAIVEQIGELTYKDSKPESEAIPYPESDWPKLSDEVMDDIREKTKNFNLALIADAMGYQRQ